MSIDEKEDDSGIRPKALFVGNHGERFLRDKNGEEERKRTGALT
jgi:hypothetical protein